MAMRLFVLGIWIVLAGTGYLASRHYRSADTCKAVRDLPAQHRLRAADLECATSDRAGELTGLYLKAKIIKQSTITRDRLSVAPVLIADSGVSLLPVSLAGRQDLARELDVGGIVTVTDGSTATGGLQVIALTCRDRADANCAVVIGVPAILRATVHDAGKLTVIGMGK